MSYESFSDFMDRLEESNTFYLEEDEYYSVDSENNGEFDVLFFDEYLEDPPTMEDIVFERPINECLLENRKLDNGLRVHLSRVVHAEFLETDSKTWCHHHQKELSKRFGKCSRCPPHSGDNRLYSKRGRQKPPYKNHRRCS